MKGRTTMRDYKNREQPTSIKSGGISININGPEHNLERSGSAG